MSVDIWYFLARHSCGLYVLNKVFCVALLLGWMKLFPLICGVIFSRVNAECPWHIFSLFFPPVSSADLSQPFLVVWILLFSSSALFILHWVLCSALVVGISRFLKFVSLPGWWRVDVVDLFGDGWLLAWWWYLWCSVFSSERLLLSLPPWMANDTREGYHMHTVFPLVSVGHIFQLGVTWSKSSLWI